MEITTRSANETERFGAKFAQQLKGGEILALKGNLGSGKTTFVKGLARGLGVRRKIQSPTFVIYNSYSLVREKNTFFHFDLYRLKKPDDFTDLGLDEIFHNQKNIIAIEWPERLRRLLPKRALIISFSHDQNESGKRHIKIG